MDAASRAGRLIRAPLTIIGLALTIAGDAAAQAWVPPRGQGAVTASFQRISNTGHRLSDGFLAKGGYSTNLSAYIETDYAVTDRLSFSAGLPYVAGKYTDSNPPPPPIPFLPWDECRCWQSGFQDFGLTARYNVLRTEGGTFSLTPSISLGLPSHSYEYRGESVVGRNLRETTIALDAGKRLDALSPNASVVGRYSYGFVQRVLGIPNNRSNATLEGRYAFFDARLTVRGFALWQVTHGGLRFGSIPPAALVTPGEVNTPERMDEHDRLLRDNHFRAGGGVSYSLARADVFASYIHYVSGTDTHAGGALTMGISWPFEIKSRR
jgi:hypothetical protein